MVPWGKRPDMIVYENDPFNAESPRAGLLSAQTAVDAFYVRNHGPVPDIAPGDATVRIDGLVDRPTTWTLQMLRERFTEHHHVATLQCAGNRRAGLIAVRDIPGEAPWGPGATSTASWSGVRLCDVLADAGVGPGATDVGFIGADVSAIPRPAEAFGGSIPLRKARAEEVLLAWSMNGEPLTAVHGGPLRVVVPGYIGARSVKWIERITVADRPSRNYFQDAVYRLVPADADPADAPGSDWLRLGPVALNCDFLSPEATREVPAGRTTITGYAVAGDDRGIGRVDVSVDGGEQWVQARLDDERSVWAWRHWNVSMDLPPGRVELLARAWDTAAAVQPEDPATVWNPKGYVNNSWARLTLAVAPAGR